ncbi:glutaredoxin-1 isoform x4 [Plakobranchus ocellatus]|uniref:Glutaredoxin-1 isoform x4 n=1 Tax=Plakobranchus ocellatus TaxID=259542 RepID=A0AAV4BJC8_9GAST|nr:glutaredoxin-1 isoform x4 [Plakobranchus ocellatus]
MVSSGQFSLPFGKKDPRLEIALKRHEPLIHFGLVCGAKSCPPIKTYSAENIYNELKLAASSFLENDDGCQVDLNSKAVKLSSIFKWYKIDFGSNNKELLEFVANHMGNGQNLTNLKELLKTEKYKLTFLPYDWSTNSNPDLAPFDFHLFGPLKRHLGGMAFETEDDLISELRNWFDNLDVDFFRVGINSLLSRWQKCIDLHGDCVEK